MRGDIAVFGFVLGASAVGGCATGVTDDGREPVTMACAADPFACRPGTTCWMARTSATFECQPSARGVALGAACDLRPGTPTCGDGMLCYQPSPPTKGTCVPFCGFGTGSHDCAQGSVCKTLQYPGGSQMHVCVEASTP